MAATRQADLDSLSLLRGEPVLIWRAAADLVTRHTSAGAAYMAQVIDPAEPEWAAPPAEEDEAAGVETDDDEAAGGCRGGSRSRVQKLEDTGSSRKSKQQQQIEAAVASSSYKRQIEAGVHQFVMVQYIVLITVQCPQAEAAEASRRRCMCSLWQLPHAVPSWHLHMDPETA